MYMMRMQIKILAQQIIEEKCIVDEYLFRCVDSNVGLYTKRFYNKCNTINYISEKIIKKINKLDHYLIVNRNK